MRILRFYSNSNSSTPLMEESFYDYYSSIIQNGTQDGCYRWLMNTIEDTEERLSGTWDYAVLTSADGIDAKIISRDFYLEKIVTEVRETFTPVAIFLSKTSVTNFTSIFEGRLITEHTINKHPTAYSYKIPYSVEHLLAMTFYLVDSTREGFCMSKDFYRFKNCGIVYHPNDAELYFSLISGHFELILNIDSFNFAKDFQAEMLKLRALIEMRNMSNFEQQGLGDFNIDYADIALVGSDIQQKIDTRIKEIQRKFFLKLPF